LREKLFALQQSTPSSLFFKGLFLDGFFNLEPNLGLSHGVKWKIMDLKDEKRRFLVKKGLSYVF
jgi:hypothetical protein